MVPQDIVLEKSLIDCHVPGLDSIVIKDGPNMVRMFIAREDHQLWRNRVHGVGSTEFQDLFSVALHRHRQDSTLMPVLGKVFNVQPQTPTSKAHMRPIMMRPYSYTSPIIAGEGHGKFELLDSHDIPLSLESKLIDKPCFMKADKLHSIYVPKGETAAWLVWEGEKVAVPSTTVYSNADLLEFDFSVMDRPMESGRLREDLEIIGVRG